MTDNFYSLCALGVKSWELKGGGVPNFPKMLLLVIFIIENYFFSIVLSAGSKFCRVKQKSAIILIIS